ncbi:MAG TPA: CDP-2,3-bis-(O-geranylgeranyl)-sn-glycerol synthase [candidate division Zixibacteria bacterium]|nr:CDP-2,3-bis-(O-geranylgeranyl)-sn-glycerol synthase [candidate division Zixibacteria bacterium]
MEITKLIVSAIIFILPAYCANATPVIAGGGLPIDLGRKFIDGKAIFGKNKTFRGFLVGLAVGTGVGLVESMIFHYPLMFGLLLSLGALFGDLAGAFLKRRLGIAPGNLLPIVDQVDFVVGALVFSLLLSPPLLTWQLALTVLLITPPIHLLTNFAAYKLGLKSNPW